MPLTTPPDVIARYQILKPIGVGGMGSLYLARDPAIDRLVAIKLLLEGMDNPELRQRFSAEARAAGRLHHQNIVTIFDVGEYERRPFIAMEYIKGETLYALVQRQAVVSLARKLDWIDKLFAGLNYAHKAGVIHRDIKPANIMIDEEGTLKILDFGIARFGDSDLTQANTVIGTLNYMAPEQMLNRPLDGRADMFSAGAVFYEMLAYRRAFPDQYPAIIHTIVSGSPEPLGDLVEGLDPAVAAIVNKCLEKDPNKRFPDLAAARRELAIVRSRIATEDPLDVGPTIQIPVLPPEATPPSGTPMGGRRPRPGDTSRQQELSRLRAEQVSASLKEANDAFARGDLNGAQSACQQALLLDPENKAVQDLDERVQATLQERHVKGWLKDAVDELDRGALTAASLLVDRALSISSASPEALEVREAIDAARKEIEIAEERARQILVAIARAKEQLDHGALDAASDAIAEVLSLEPANADALALKRQVDAAIAAKRKAAEDARAQSVVDAARRTFAAGQIDAALQMLSSFAPPHALVTRTLGDLRLEAKEIERRREIERVRREIAEKLESASGKMREQDFAGALALVAEILAREPQHADALALKARAETALQRARQIASEFATAKQLAGKQQFQEALAVIARIAALDPKAAGLADLRKAVDAGIEAEATARVKREFDGHMAAAAKALQSRDLPRALDRIQAAARIDLDHDGVVALRKKIDQAIDDAQAATRSAASQGNTVVLPQNAGAFDSNTVRIDGPVVGPVTVAMSSSGVSAVEGVATSPGRTIVLPVEPEVLKDVERETRKPRVPRMALGVAAVLALALVGGVALKFWPPPPPPPPTPGAGTPITLNIAPWAKIEAVTSVSDRHAMDIGDAVTPCVLALPPGAYHVRASNPNFPTPLEFDFTVADGGAQQDVRQVMPGFQPDQEINQILDK